MRRYDLLARLMPSTAEAILSAAANVGAKPAAAGGGPDLAARPGEPA